MELDIATLIKLRYVQTEWGLSTKFQLPTINLYINRQSNLSAKQLVEDSEKKELDTANKIIDAMSKVDNLSNFEKARMFALTGSIYSFAKKSNKSLFYYQKSYQLYQEEKREKYTKRDRIDFLYTQFDLAGVLYRLSMKKEELEKRQIIKQSSIIPQAMVEYNNSRLKELESNDSCVIM